MLERQLEETQKEFSLQTHFSLIAGLGFISSLKNIHPHPQRMPDSGIRDFNKGFYKGHQSINNNENAWQPATC